MLPWLDSATPYFPDVSMALNTPDGLLAAGGALTPDWLVSAYRQGIFPWFSDGDPILWWSPDPRMVLYPENFRQRRSLTKRLRNGGFTVTLDQCFERVMLACAAPRQDQDGTWITNDMLTAYAHLHKAGIAHSIEVHRDNALVGGLYGLAMGPVFFGESMFSRQADASKVALAYLAAAMRQGGGTLIDCQMHTAHLAHMGAETISRTSFIKYLGLCLPQRDFQPSSGLEEAPTVPPSRWLEALAATDNQGLIETAH